MAPHPVDAIEVRELRAAVMVGGQDPHLRQPVHDQGRAISASRFELTVTLEIGLQLPARPVEALGIGDLALVVVGRTEQQ